MLDTRLRMVAGHEADSDAAFYDYEIPYSTMFDATNYEKYARTAGTPTNQSKWTVSMWVKRGYLAYEMLLTGRVNGGQFTHLYFDHNDKLAFYVYNGSCWGTIASDMVFRDTASWYHIVFTYDSAQAVEGDRLTMYVNGVEQSYTQSLYTLAQNQDSHINQSGVSQGIGCYGNLDGSSFRGQMAEVHFVDGQALGCSDFGEFKQGIWVPKDYAGSYGNNGYHLDFANASDMGNDVSGNDNDFSFSTLQSCDHQTLDTPTNNHCTLNPLDKCDATNYPTNIRRGGLLIPGENLRGCGATFELPKTGKWFWVAEWTGGAYPQFGLGCSRFQSGGATPGFFGWYNNQILYDTGFTAADNEVVNEDYFVMCVDCDNGKIWLGGYNAGTTTTTWVGGAPDRGSECTFSGPGGGGLYSTAFDIDSDNWMPVAGSSTDGCSLEFDFGQNGFPFEPPSGFKALCANNLPEPQLIETSDVIDVLTYSGDGTASRNLPGMDFTTGEKLLWLKGRNNGYSFTLYDTLRGAGNDKELSSDSTAVEGGLSCDSRGYVSAFRSDGFSVADGTGDRDYVNHATNIYVAWMLNMIPAYGMDIVTYTGDGQTSQVINHALGAVPHMIIIKNRDDQRSWIVYHHETHPTTAAEEVHMMLDQSSVAQDDTGILNDTAPTASQFTVGSQEAVNYNGHHYVAYLFRSIPGLIKCGVYIGNGDSSGPMVYTGFKPRFVLLKATNDSRSWFAFDSERNPSNPVNKYLQVNSANPEGTSTYLDFLSNGFKVRYSSGDINGNGYQYVYLAIAEAPFKYTTAA